MHVGDGMIVVVARARRVKGPQKDIEGYCHDDVRVMMEGIIATENYRLYREREK